MFSQRHSTADKVILLGIMAISKIEAVFFAVVVVVVIVVVVVVSRL